jgi:hypothetical protein
MPPEEKPFKLEMTITLGNLLSIATVLTAVIVGWVKLEARLATIEIDQIRFEQGAGLREGRIRALELRDATVASDIQNIKTLVERIDRKLDARVVP